MNIGLIADIHADPQQLDAVLAGLASVDRLLCAGDLTGYGPQPNAVIETIRQRQIPTVKGNHDSPSAEITPRNAAFLRKLPLAWSQTIAGKRLYMCHGIPGVPFIGITPQHFDDERLGALFDQVAADIIIAGHTHQPWVKHLPDGRCFINPGAVYLGSYAVLRLPSVDVAVHSLA